MGIKLMLRFILNIENFERSSYMKKRLSLVMVLMFMLTLLPGVSLAADYNLWINGSATGGMITEDEGTKMIPVRYLANGLNLGLMWNQTTKTATTMFDGKDIMFTADSNTAMVDNENVTLDKAPMLMGGRLYISEMTIQEIMNLTVEIEGINAMINTMQQLDIVDTAVSAGSFTTLATALTDADLVETLKGEGPFTVFAPTDEAFAKLPAGTLENLLLPENKDMLVDILTYHVVSGEVLAADVVGLSNATMLNGDDVAITVMNEQVMVNSANVVSTDIMASNGVIHVIDEVLMPPTN